MIGRALLYLGGAFVLRGVLGAGTRRRASVDRRPAVVVPSAEQVAGLSRRISQSLDSRVVMREVVEQVSDLLNGPAALYMLDPSGSRILLRAVHYGRRDGVRWAHVVPAVADLGGVCLRDAKPAYTADVARDDRVVAPSRLLRDKGAQHRARLAVPLVSRGRTIGLLVVADRTGRVFREEDLDMATAFASRAALALENAYLFEESQRRRMIAEHLADVGRLLSHSLDPQVVAARVVESVQALFGSRSAAVFKLEAGTGDLIPLAVCGPGAATVGRISPRMGAGLAGLAIQERRPVWSSDIHTDSRIVYSPEMRGLLETWGLSTALVVPLVVQGEVIGTLGILDPKGRVYSSEEMALAETFADQAALAIQNARLYEQTRHRLRHTEMLLSVGQMLSRTLDLGELMRRVAREIGRGVEADMVGAYLPSPDGAVMHPLAGYRVPDAIRRKSRECPLRVRGHPFVEEARDLDRPVFSSDTAADPRVDPVLLEQFPCRSALFTPMSSEGQLIGGILAVWDEPGRRFEADEIRLVHAIAQQASVHVVNAKLYWELGRRLSEAEELAEAVQSSNEALQRLSAQIVQVQEMERRGLARELHDQMGQILTTLKTSLRIGLREAPPEIGGRLRDAVDLVDELLRRIKGLSLDLRPALLDDLGLLPALLWHFEQYTATTKVRVNFRHSGLDRRFRPEVDTAVYRVVQEALTNVARHSQIEEVEVTAWVDAEQIEVQIEDRGVGFEIDGAPVRRSSGLSGMNERLALLGGRLTVESSPGNGTTVRGIVPIEKSAALPFPSSELRHGDHARPR